MHKIYQREIAKTVRTRLNHYPAVALLGARQTREVNACQYGD